VDPKTPKKKQRDKGFYVIVAVAFVLAVIFILKGGLSAGTHPAKVNYSDVHRYFMTHNVEHYETVGSSLRMTLKVPDPKYDGTVEVEHSLYSFSMFYEDNRVFIDEAADPKSEFYNPDFEYNYKESFFASPWLSIVPYVIVMIVFIFVFNMMMNRTVGGGGGGDRGARGFSKARTRLASEDKRKVTFKDVAGADEEKAELAEIVDFLKNPQKYVALGARIPKGVLLVGPPGTGKTLIAKAVAGEAGVQFLSISGSDFVELYVGVGASRVRDLFDQAKKLAPSIIFIDEIDAVGRQRGAGLGGGHDEREQTLNQLLVEMDGFNTNDGVIIIAATNRSDILDSALLRPGRFDRQVYVGMPDIKGREEILKVHARGKRFDEDVDLAGIAKSTTGFTGADLENLLNESALLAARENKLVITMTDIETATLKVIAGPEKKSRIVTEKTRKLVAYHEAGHAVAGYFLKDRDPVHHISIIPRGQSNGITVYRPDEEKEGASRSEMFASIVSSLGGRIAEKLMLDDISTGASSDIQNATKIARAMVATYGMSDEIGPIAFDDTTHSVFIGRDYQQTKSYSEKTAAALDDAVKDIFDKAIAECTRILTENQDILEATAKYLLAHETMDGDKFALLVEHGLKIRNGEVEPQPIPSEPTDEPQNTEN
jgi:cell division protease FtsH